MIPNHYGIKDAGLILDGSGPGPFHYKDCENEGDRPCRCDERAGLVFMAAYHDKVSDNDRLQQMVFNAAKDEQAAWNLHLTQVADLQKQRDDLKKKFDLSQYAREHLSKNLDSAILANKTLADSANAEIAILKARIAYLEKEREWSQDHHEDVCPIASRLSAVAAKNIQIKEALQMLWNNVWHSVLPGTSLSIAVKNALAIAIETENAALKYPWCFACNKSHDPRACADKA